jgi:hypothetical protein
LSEKLDPSHLLLVETGAEVPGWLDSSRLECLEQHYSELYLSFIRRCADWLCAHPSVQTVVVALCISSAEDLDDRVQAIGARLVSALRGRPRARVLFSAPSDTPEPQRRRLLSATAGLAQHEDSLGSCIVGAHFSASSPSSSRIPVIPA